MSERLQDVIAEIVSLSGYESQVSALLNYIACAPEDYPVIPGAGGFRKARWARRAKGKSGGFRAFISSWPDQDEFIWLRFMPRRVKETLSAADRNVVARLAVQIKKAAKGG
jgi:hypothetical protein